MNRSLNILWKILAAMCVLALIPACGSTTPIEEKEPLKVEFTNWWGDYTLLIAQQTGLFKKYNVNVKPVYYDVFSKAIPDLAAEQIDGGLFAIGDAINVNHYTDVKAVAVYDNGSLNTIVSVPEIFSLASLKGKRIGVPIGTSYELLIGEVLKSVGLTTSDVRLVNINPEDVPLNLGDTIDAGFVYEPYTSQAIAEGNSLLINTDQFVGLYPDVIVFRASVVEQRQEDIRNFLKAWFEAVQFRNENPDEAIRIIAQFQQVPENKITPDAQLNLLTLDDNVAIYKQQDNQEQRSIYDTAKLNADFLVRIGVLTTYPDLNTMLDPSFLK